jgi:DNA-binding NarL/FixJ family response regulator
VTEGEAAPSHLRVVIAEDSVLLLAGLTKLLDSAGFDVVATAGDAEELLAAVDLLSANTSSVGYLLKDRVADVAEFLDALRRVAAGGTALDPEVVAQLLVRRSGDPLDALTQRERDVLALMAEGHSNAEIGAALVVTDSAVSKHINSIFAKLGLHPGDTGHRRVLAVLRYLGAG